MRAMVLSELQRPLVLDDLETPSPHDGQVRIRVEACAVCRTDLHIVDGELAEPRMPLVPGHQIVGTVDETGSGVDSIAPGDRVGVPWLGWTCGRCEFCAAGRENLCENPRFTGYHVNGGFAEYALANARYCLPLPDNMSSVHTAPLLCGGLIGFRSLRKCGDARTIGFYGFGSAAHVITQIAIAEGRKIFAFTRDGDEDGQAFARKTGATWAGGSSEMPPERLDAAVIFAPVGPLVPAALQVVLPGGSVVCAGIHMSDIPSFPYGLLWEERSLVSVANLTRQDGIDFFETIRSMDIRTKVTTYSLENANEALGDIKAGRIKGTAVLEVGDVGRRT